jgi:alpha-galactosidase
MLIQVSTLLFKEKLYYMTRVDKQWHLSVEIADFIRRLKTCVKIALGFYLILVYIPCAVGNTNDAAWFHNLQTVPESIVVITEKGSNSLDRVASKQWHGNGITVWTKTNGNDLAISIAAPNVGVKSMTIRWTVSMPADWKYLGDAWERGYGDLEWKELDALRVMPWYFLVSDGKTTHGYGVKTGSGALCYWTVDANGITLHADVRCGGMGVKLGGRTLNVCTVVSRQGETDESPIVAARAFCQIMCPNPRLPKEPIIGFNNWYCTYGHDTGLEFLTNVAFVVSHSPKNGNRPFAVVDGGWQRGDTNGAGTGHWNDLNPEFSKTLTMPELAAKMRELGARPGLWYRPLMANVDQPKNWRSQRDPQFLDPTVPAVRAYIQQMVTRFRRWGYELIKNDFSTYDICGCWGMQMGSQITPDGWAFADHSKTTAEVIRDLYQDMRVAAGNDVLIEGCNTMGHLSAGIFELQRIGDDTSGTDWDRTRKMGVNSLAFRLPQNGTFFATDADCVGQVTSDSVPWVKNSQWLTLLSESSTPLFVSFRRETLGPDQEAALRAALTAASLAQPQGEPLDWMSQRTPEQWQLGTNRINFSW